MNKITKDLYNSLKRVEWASNDCNGKGSYCYSCSAYQSEGEHASDCHIGDSISQYELALKVEALIQDDSYMKWIKRL